MGYRSQVVIGFDKKAFWKHVEEDIKDFKDCDLIEECEENVVFIWEDAKWYDSYADVISVMRVFNKVLEDDEYEDIGAGFLRVGEEEGDIETQGSPSEFDIYAVTTVNAGDGTNVEHDKFFAPNSVKFIRGDGDGD